MERIQNFNQKHWKQRDGEAMNRIDINLCKLWKFALKKMQFEYFDYYYYFE